jgi:hypothetical protein
MACQLGKTGGYDLDKAKADMLKGGWTEEEANVKLAKALKADQLGSASTTILTYVVNNNGDFNTRKAAAAKIASRSLGVTLANKDLKNNEYVKQAWKDKGVYIERLDGVFDNEKVKNDKTGDYLGVRLDAGDPDAKKYVTTDLEKKPIEEKIKLIDTLAQNDKFNSQQEMLSAVGEKNFNAYVAYYKDPINLDWTKVKEADIIVDGNNIRVKLQNPLLSGTQVPVVLDGALLGPDGKYIPFDPKTNPFGIYDIPGEYGKNQKWVINLKKYGDEILNEKDDKKQATGFEKFLYDITNDKLEDWYTCDGLGCPSNKQDQSGGFGGGGGGGGGNNATYKKTTTETNPSLYVESNEDADVYEGGTKIGTTNSIITRESGTHTIEVRKKGYKRATKVIEIGSYPVNVTMNIYRVTTGPATFISSIGGLQNLTKKHALFLFAIYKARLTGALDWRTLATETMSTATAPERLEINDVKYVWYMANGEPGKAAQLVTDGKVSLLDGEE